jgi:hypothetical protein
MVTVACMHCNHLPRKKRTLPLPSKVKLRLSKGFSSWYGFEFEFLKFMRSECSSDKVFVWGGGGRTEIINENDIHGTA